MEPSISDNIEELTTLPAAVRPGLEQAVPLRTISMGSGSGFDADTLGRKKPDYFAKDTGDAAKSFSLLNMSLAGYIEGVEIADPSAPATNYGRLYFRDNGAGKTQLVVRFPTGAIQVIATEP